MIILKSNTMKNAYYNILKTLAVIIFPIITFSYASRIFLSEGMGQINFAKSLVAIFTLIAMLGIESYGTREGARLRDDKKKLSEFFKEIFLINVIAGIVSYIVLFALMYFSDKVYAYKPIILITSLLIGLTVIGVEWLYYAVEDYRFIAIRTCWMQIIALILLIVFVHDQNDLLKYVAIQLFATGGAYLINFFHARKYIDWTVKIKWRLKRHLKPILYLFLMTFLIKIFTELDVTMLGVLAGDRATGLYSSAHKISMVLSSMLGAVIGVMLPKMSYLSGKGDSEEIDGLLKNGINFLLLIGLPLVVGSYIFSSNFLEILSGHDFLKAEFCSQVLSFRSLLSPLNGLFVTNYLMSMKKDKQCICITGVAAVINIVTNYILIPLYQQDGAAFATVLAESFELIVNLFIVGRMTSISFMFYKTWKYFLATLIMIPITCIFKLFVSNIVLQLVAGTMVSALVYFFTLYIMKCTFLDRIIQIIKKKLSLQHP